MIQEIVRIAFSYPQPQSTICLEMIVFILAAMIQQIVGTAFSDLQCTICLGMLAPENTCLRMPCKHVFHSTCLVPWLEKVVSDEFE